MSVSNRPLKALALAAVLLITAAPAAALAGAQSESYTTLVAQLNQSQVRSATIFTKDHHAEVTLNDGRQFTVSYPPTLQSELRGALTSHGAIAQVAGTSSSGHVRYRYIALAIIVLGGLAALAYYLMRGRPSAGREAGAATTPAADAPPSAGTPPPGPPAAGAAPPPVEGGEQR